MESVVAGKARVHELAKELGVTSKEVLARLSEQGEFVKSASSTVEAPVARRLREAFGGGKAAQAGNGAGVKKSAAGAPAKGPTPRPAAPAAPAPPAAPAAPPAAPVAPPAAPAAPIPEPPRPAAAAGPRAPAAAAPAPSRVAPPGPTGSPRPGPAPKPAPRALRVGNTPFSSAPPIDRPIP